MSHVHNVCDLRLVGLREALCSLTAASLSALAGLVPGKCVPCVPLVIHPIFYHLMWSPALNMRCTPPGVRATPVSEDMATLSLERLCFFFSGRTIVSDEITPTYLKHFKTMFY